MVGDSGTSGTQVDVDTGRARLWFALTPVAILLVIGVIAVLQLA